MLIVIVATSGQKETNLIAAMPAINLSIKHILAFTERERRLPTLAPWIGLVSSLLLGICTLVVAFYFLIFGCLCLCLYAKDLCCTTACLPSLPDSWQLFSISVKFFPLFLAALSFRRFVLRLFDAGVDFSKSVFGKVLMSGPIVFRPCPSTPSPPNGIMQNSK